MYQVRELEKIIKQIDSFFPVLLITGPRQVGKTTILKKLAHKTRQYISLDDPNLCNLARKDPALFLEKYPPPVLIDEVQYAPELFPYIKIKVDQEQKKGLFWLTGSQQFQMMNNVSESLAGRVGILQMQGFSTFERQNIEKKNINLTLETVKDYLILKESAPKYDLLDLYKMIWQGSFPAICNEENIDNRHIFYDSYVKTYIERDVRSLINIKDEYKFLKFVQVIAARTGQVINYADIAANSDLNHRTVKEWLSILIKSGLVYLLHPYYSNITNKIIKTPKIYFLDTGLCCYLTKWQNHPALEAGAMSGSILESFVVSEILKSYWNNGKDVRNIYFYRDKKGKEIDLLIEKNGKIYPIEIKKTSMVRESSIKNFSTLEKYGNLGTGILIYLGKEILPINKNNVALPIEYI